MRFSFRLALICSLVLLLTAAKRRTPTLAEAIDREIGSQFDSAFIGIHVISLRDGRTLYQRNQDRLFTPASNAKLFVLALALMRLGPGYRFTTSVLGSGPVENGVLRGDLILAGGGDPTLSARTYPYTTGTSTADPLQPIEDLAAQIASKGIGAIDGDIVGDDSRYPWRPYPGSWNIGDALWSYGAPVSALVVNDNRLDVTLTPGDSDGDPALITVAPPVEWLTIENLVRTVAPGLPHKLTIQAPGDLQLRIAGEIAADRSETESLAVPDPARFAAAVLREALIRHGVRVRGQAVARHGFTGGMDPPEPPPVAGNELARHTSPPLSQILQVTAKVSQNLYTELLLLEARTGAHAELKDFLTEAGVDENCYQFADGSGLSRSDLVSPQAITHLLAYMDASRYRAEWLAMLPVGSEDGTLKDRFKGHPEARDIHAKTGSLGNVRTLSGYAESRRHGRVAFSIMVNHYLAKDSEVARFLDNIGLKLLR